MQTKREHTRSVSIPPFPLFFFQFAVQWGGEQTVGKY